MASSEHSVVRVGELSIVDVDGHFHSVLRGGGAPQSNGSTLGPLMQSRSMLVVHRSASAGQAPRDDADKSHHPTACFDSRTDARAVAADAITAPPNGESTQVDAQS